VTIRCACSARHRDSTLHRSLVLVGEAIGMQRFDAFQDRDGWQAGLGG